MKIKIVHFKSNQKGLFLFKNQHTVEKLQFQRINHIHNSFYLFFYSESKKMLIGVRFRTSITQQKEKCPKMFLCHWFFSSCVLIFVNRMNDQLLRFWTILKVKASKLNLYLNCIFTLFIFNIFHEKFELKCTAISAHLL